jgi:hypothetical protein
MTHIHPYEQAVMFTLTSPAGLTIQTTTWRNTVQDAIFPHQLLTQKNSIYGGSKKMAG